jgi:hypothetical protein
VEKFSERGQFELREILNNRMETDEQDLRDAVIYTKYSLFITIVSLPFGLMGFIL